MIIQVTALPEVTKGIYTIHGVPGQMPARALFLHPRAAASFGIMEKTIPLVYSDIFRSAEASLVAVSTKAGTQPPGYSAHNYGLAVDVAVDAVLMQYGWTYSRLVEELAQFGWYCHRRDGRRGAEDWHFNYLGPSSDTYLSRVDVLTPETWAYAVEARIREFYGEEFTLSNREVQMALMKLRLYKGSVDGIFGPLTLEAAHAFQRAWKLHVGEIDARTVRTLAYVACERMIVPPVTLPPAPPPADPVA